MTYVAISILLVAAIALLAYRFDRDMKKHEATFDYHAGNGR